MSAMRKPSNSLPRKRVPSAARLHRMMLTQPLPGSYTPADRALLTRAVQRYNGMTFRTLAAAGRVGKHSRVLRGGLGLVGGGAALGLRGASRVQRLFAANGDGYFDGLDADQLLVMRPADGIPGPYYQKCYHQVAAYFRGKAGEGKSFEITEILPSDRRLNGKTVFLGAGLGMSNEGFWRNGDKTVDDSILRRLMERGFRVLIVDFPGIGKNRDYSLDHNTVDMMINEICPTVADFLEAHPEMREGGLYWLSHSLGGLTLNAFMASYFKKHGSEHPHAMLFKNKMTIGTPEAPVNDKHILNSLVIALHPFFGDRIRSIPYESLGPVVEKIPPRLLMNSLGEFSMISVRGIDPGQVAEMFDCGVKNFSAYLALELSGGFLRGHFRDLDDLPIILLDGQRNVRVTGDVDPLAPTAGLYWRFAQENGRRDMVALYSVRDAAEAKKRSAHIGEQPITAFGIPDMTHLELSCVNPHFDAKVWPIVLAFLEETSRVALA